MIRPLGLLLPLALAACGGASSPPSPSPSSSIAVMPPGGPTECVPYARAVSGIAIHGDAWTWWAKADGRYLRGKLPRPGAVLVFSRTKRLRRGHVSVVTEVISRREILVTHANWGSTAATRGRVTRNVPVIDISPGNDWSAVKVWNLELGVFGRPYAAQGFIYPGLAGA